MNTEEPKRYIKCLVAAYLVSGLLYMGWRLGTINMSAPLFSIPLYAAELYGYVSGLLFVLMTYRLSVREAPPPQPGITVDVYVPTYNESIELIRRTLLAAMRLDYPHVTWLLDDGRRESMRALAEELGCRYLTRDNNAHAKAGNLNNALKHSTGEFIAIFDADHAPRKDFLVRTLGYFQDERVAFVQTPQDFFNIDSFNHRLGKKRVWDEQALFFKIIQRGKDALNAAFFCGSCAVIRRSAVARIGGFATETVTEDVHTAIRMHKLGYQSVYHAESLAFGLAPHSIDTYLKQRMRWGMGSMQVFRRERILFGRGLTLGQRLNYLASALFFFEGWQKLVFFLTPPAVFLFGVLPIVSPLNTFLLWFCLYYLLSILVHLELGRGYNSLFLSEQYAMARFFAFMSTSVGLFRRNIPFAVTDKQMSQTGRMWLWLSPLLMVCGVAAASVPVGLYRIHIGTIPLGAGLVTLFWTLMTLGSAVVVAAYAYKHSRNRRTEYRFPLRVPVTLMAGEKTYLGLTSDLSPNGALYIGEAIPNLALGDVVDVAVHLPNLIVRDTAVATFVKASHPASASGMSVGLHFNWSSQGNTGALETFLFGSRLQLEMGGVRETETPPLTRLAEILRREEGKPSIAQSWAAALLMQPLRVGMLPVAIATIEGAAPLLFSSIELDLDAGATLRRPAMDATGKAADQAIRLMPTGRLITPTGDFHLYNFALHGAA
ncbi:glycosyltransferase [Cupriavidus consociatus]|uniref:glycosyltransferase n=1 Tax=Cupriavidus consociatus TaxID=2821357 RepID=UPI001AEA8FE1|nr:MULTISPECIES: glycosyltransferase [unclassified Cupriavidus]MBP0623234.1 glycosyltransferase [Cupriavidus sp. LEh25]MDK2659927.1 glycosyltransferase [Cupriavidus sp. LEh21]